MNNRRGYDDFGGRQQRRPSGYGDMMQTENYKSMRSGSLDALGDDFDEPEDVAADSRRPHLPHLPTRRQEEYVPKKTAAQGEMLFDDMPDDQREPGVSADGFRDDFYGYNYGFDDSFDPVTTSHRIGGPQTLDEYRAARGKQTYSVREEQPTGRPAPPPPAPPVRKRPEPVESGFSDGFDDEWDDAPATKPRAAARRRSNDFSDGFDDEWDDSPSQQSNDFTDDFSDDFEDDFDAPPSRAQRRRSDSFTDDFDDDWNDEPVPARASASTGRRTDGSRPGERPPQQQRHVRPRPVDNLNAAQRDMVRQRPAGMPELFAQYLVDDNADRRLKQKKKNYKRAKTRKVLITLAGIAAAAVIAVGLAMYFTSIPKKPIEMRSGFQEVDSEVLFNMLKTSVDKKLSKEAVTVDVNGTNYKVKLADYDFAYAAPGTAPVTYLDVLSGTEIVGKQSLVSDGSIICNETKIKQLLTDLSATQGDTMIEPYYKIDGDQMTVYAGTDGVGIDYDEFLTELKKSVRGGSKDVIEANVHKIEAPAVDMDKIYSEVACEAKDASTATSDTGELIFIDEIVGKDFDVEKAKSIVNNAGGSSWNIQLTLTQPQLNVIELRAPYCLDKLSSWASHFNNKTNKARCSNIKLAAESLNGTIIQPGEKFSFNSTVGERTVERGYSYATVFTSEGADTGVGGGVCQVSSTLYYTALLCNLYIPKAENNEEDGRLNHAYSVGYMEVPGTDATVSWPWPDLYIVNDKDYPIKIVMYVEEDYLHCEFWGTADGYSCTIGYTSSNWTQYSTVYKHATAAKPAGTKSNGAAGYTITTRRNVYKDGKLMYTKTEENSVYKPLNKVLYVDSLPSGAHWAD